METVKRLSTAAGFTQGLLRWFSAVAAVKVGVASDAPEAVTLTLAIEEMGPAIRELCEEQNLNRSNPQCVSKG